MQSDAAVVFRQRYDLSAEASIDLLMGGDLHNGLLMGLRNKEMDSSGVGRWSDYRQRAEACQLALTPARFLLYDLQEIGAGFPLAACDDANPY
jgi:hypothetical protein